MEVISAHSLLVITNHMALPSGKMFGKCHKFRNKRIRYWEALEGVPYCCIETALFILKFNSTFLMTHLLILLFSSCIILFQNWDTLRNPFELLAKVAGILKKINKCRKIPWPLWSAPHGIHLSVLSDPLV